jgi:predicted nucleic acid-binding protein
MYLDTSAAAKLYLPEPESEAIQRLVEGTGPLVSSDLLVPEFASMLARKRREGEIGPSAQRQVWALFQEHLTAGHWNLVTLTGQDYRRAADLVLQCQGTVPLRALDALHLAVCQGYGLFPLCTTDKVMQRAAVVLGIPLVGRSAE